MIGKNTGSGIETGIGYAPLSHAAVVERGIFYQPVHGIVSVRCFIYISFRFLVIQYRRHVCPGAFAFPAAAYVLVHKDVCLFHDRFRRAEAGRKSIYAIRRHTIAGTLHDDRIFVLGGSIFRCINSGEQLYTVAHGNINFLFIKVFLYIRIGIARTALCKCRGKADQ